MNILFLCVGNSARSQIAEGLANDMFGKGNNIQSAGSVPARNVHQEAINTLADIGVDISKNYPKSFDELDNDFIQNLDYVITLCKDEICPVLPNNVKTFHWALEDPDNKKNDAVNSKFAFIKTRDDLFNLLKKFMIDNLLNNNMKGEMDEISGN